MLNLSEGTVGIKDDYFSLGGNSINAIKLLGKINKKFNVNLKISEFYVNQTISHIANLVNKSNTEFKLLINLNESFAKKKMFMVHPGLSGCEVYYPLAKSLSENFHCIGNENYNLHHYEKIQ